MENEILRCLTCQRLTLQLEGYSDYTVTGENMSCQAKQFEGIDRECENSIFDKAKNCSYFSHGRPIEISVGGEVSVH